MGVVMERWCPTQQMLGVFLRKHEDENYQQSNPDDGNLRRHLLGIHGLAASECELAVDTREAIRWPLPHQRSQRALLVSRLVQVLLRKKPAAVSRPSEEEGTTTMKHRSANAFWTNTELKKGRNRWKHAYGGDMVRFM
jgi:hypothetical protein